MTTFSQSPALALAERAESLAASVMLEVPYTLIRAVGDVETGWNVKLSGQSGAAGECGFLQVMPDTGELMGTPAADLKASEWASLYAGVKYLAALKREHGTWEKAIGYYNARSADKRAVYTAKVEKALRAYHGIMPDWWTK